MKKLLMTAMLFAASVGLMKAQTVQRQVVEEGGTGPFKSEVVGDASCPGFTVWLHGVSSSEPERGGGAKGIAARNCLC